MTDATPPSRPPARPRHDAPSVDIPDVRDELSQHRLPGPSSEIPEENLVREPTPEERAARLERRERRRARRRRAQRRRRIRRVLVALAVVLVVALLALAAEVRYVFGGLDRIPSPLSATGGTPGTTILLVGSDPAAHDEVTSDVSWRQDLGRSDLVMVMHLSADRQALYSISIPATARVPVPGKGRARLGQAFAAGGARLYVRSIEKLTGARIDHLAVMDLNGIREVSDEVGGLEVNVPDKACGEAPGLHRMDGERALAFMRLRRCLPHGDLDRVARQQAVLKALLAATLDGGTISNPLRLNRLAHATFAHLALERDWGYWGIAKLGWSMRDIGPGRTTFLTAPTLGPRRGPVRLDPARGADLWSALRQDRLAEYAQLNRAG